MTRSELRFSLASHVKVLFPELRSMRMMTKGVLADMIGITAVALASGAVAAALYRSQAISQPWLVWLIALPFLVGASLWVWHISEKTRNFGRAIDGAMRCFLRR